MNSVRRAVMTQTWANLAYLHFDYDPAEIQALLPTGVDVDTFEGRAYVGLIPFSMRKVGIPRLPAVPYLGTFSEINVRTYVTRGGVPGVWFFSLDVDRLLPAFVARLTYRLPYCWGQASHDVTGHSLTTTVRRRWPRHESRNVASTRIEMTIGDPITQPTDFDIWSTARWGLYSRGFGSRLMYAPVSHPEWPLYSATLNKLDDSLVAAAGLTPSTAAPRCLFSPGVPVRIGMPRHVTW